MVWPSATEKEGRSGRRTKPGNGDASLALKECSHLLHEQALVRLCPKEVHESRTEADTIVPKFLGTGIHRMHRMGTR
jgi:hypothetical protein